MTRWAVVVVTDGNLVDEAAQLLDEVTRLCSGTPHVYCFARDLDAAQRAHLDRVPRLTVLDIADVDAPTGPPIIHHAASSAPLFYARFECWSDRFDAYDTVVYLDADTAVMADLRQLTHLAFYATAEVDGRSPFVDEHDPEPVSLVEEDRWANPVSVRVNSGVIALGRAWRAPEQRALLHRITDRYGTYLRVGDQSVLDVWMHANGLTATPDASWNCQVRRTVGRQGGRASVHRARVLHFNGLKLANQRLALRNARVWLRVPFVGRDLFVLTHHAMFHDRDLRPTAKRAVRVAGSARDRVRAFAGVR